MGHMSQADWERYQQVINTYHDDAFQQEVTWISYNTITDIHGEDTNRRPIETIIKGLVQYNSFRSWPITGFTDSGSMDKESCMLFLNLNYLDEQSLLNSEGQFQFNPGEDKFIINGVTYKPSGESQDAQANGKTLLTFIVLKREQLETSNELY